MTIWFFTALAIVGAILNSMQKRVCFIIWSITNAYLIAHNLIIEEYAQATIWIVYEVITVYGWFNWGKRANGK